MKFKLTFLIVVFTSTISFSQVKESNNMWAAKEFSKDIALYNSKSFLFKNVLGVSSEVVQFEVIPLAAASSGELTTLLYKCDNKQKEGLILGFYGMKWNDAGVVYQGYSFKNLDKNQAIEFLNKIQEAIDNNTKFIADEPDNNNIYFRYDDIDVLIWGRFQTFTIRLFWNGFDSTWERTAYDRSKRRFEKKIK